jgi:Uncharacterized protein with conserved CXXC pairs
MDVWSDNMKRKVTCIVCPRGCRAIVELIDGEIKEISGLKCNKGEDYIKQEVTHPFRLLFTTIPIERAKNIDVLPIRTSQPIPKDLLDKGLNKLSKIKVNAPVKIGDVIIKDFMGTGVDVVASRSAKSE